MYYFYDATYILVIIGAIISLIASMNVKSTFNRYDKYNSRSGLTGAMAAQEILRAAGITNVRIERVSGNLTDHYSPKEGVLRLSDSVYNSTSVAAIGVAAHECGHAMQYDEEYFPIKIRAAVIPIANIGSALSWPIILLGLFLGASLTVTIFITGNGIYQLSRYIAHGTIQRSHIFCCPYLEGSASYRVFA